MAWREIRLAETPEEMRGEWWRTKEQFTWEIAIEKDRVLGDHHSYEIERIVPGKIFAKRSGSNSTTELSLVRDGLLRVASSGGTVDLFKWEKPVPYDMSPRIVSKEIEKTSRWVKSTAIATWVIAIATFVSVPLVGAWMAGLIRMP